jgi:hypothetical protein
MELKTLVLVFHGYDKISEQNNLSFTFAHGFRGSIPSWKGGHGEVEKLTYWQPGSRERECPCWWAFIACGSLACGLMLLS